MDGGFLGIARVEVDHGEHDVARGGVRLGVGHDVLIVHVVEGERAQLLQGRVFAADAVEHPDVGLERVAGVERRLEVARAQLVLLGVEVFLTAGRDGLVLVELEAGVHAPQRGERRRERGADGEHGASAGLQGLVQDVWGVDKHIGAADIGLLQVVLDKLREVVLGGLPREVGVGLRKARLGQAQQARGAREGLGEEDDVRVRGMHLGDEPRPEVGGLGMRVVHAEGLYAGVHPDHDHVVDGLVDAVWVVVEVERVDVLVLLGWVLCIRDGAVVEHREELRVGLRPWVVRCALEGQIEGDLEAERLGVGEEVLEVLHRAQLRVRGRVVLDGPRGTHVARLCSHRIVAALAVHLADGMNGREVDGVKTHLRHAGQRALRGLKGAVDGVAICVPTAGGAGEELVPGAVAGLGTLDVDFVNLAFGDELAQRVVLENFGDLGGEGGGDALGEGGIGSKCLGRSEERARLVRGGLECGAGKEVGAVGEIVGELLLGLAGVHLLRHGVAPRGHDIAPRVDAEEPAARGGGGKDGMDAIRVDGVEVHGRRGDRGGLRIPHRQRGGDGVVAFAPDQGRDGDDLPNGALGGQLPAGDDGADIVNAQAAECVAVYARGGGGRSHAFSLT